MRGHAVFFPKNSLRCIGEGAALQSCSVQWSDQGVKRPDMPPTDS